MSVPTDQPVNGENAIKGTTNGNVNGHAVKTPTELPETPSKPSMETPLETPIPAPTGKTAAVPTSTPAPTQALLAEGGNGSLLSVNTNGSSKDGVDPTLEFTGDIDTNNTLPSTDMIARVENLPVLDKDGRSRPFKSLYTGPNVARRVLIIFVRHFFCGNCQEYLRTLTQSISPDSLYQLPIPTFIAVIGCGGPSLINMYQEATACPFPIYADPTSKLYQELGMTRTWALGQRPEYMRKNMLASTLMSIVQGLKQVRSGRVTKAGDMQQVGGEFLFEPVASDGGIAESPINEGGESKEVTWCHRMRNTRDHAEIPELREVLGLEGIGESGGNKRRWSRAVGERKGTGLSAMSKNSDDGEKVLLPSTAGTKIPQVVPEA